MPSKTRTYYYDTESCTYQPARITLKSVLRRLGVLSIVVLVVGTSTWFLLADSIETSRNSQLQTQQTSLIQALERRDAVLDKYESVLQKHYDRANWLYRPMMEEDQISKSFWQGGRGGINRYDRTNVEITQRMDLRVENIRHQIDLLNNSLRTVHFKSDRKEDELKNMPSISPVNGNLISGFGNRRHPVSGRIKFHDGLDFACPSGTPLYASGNGVIEAVGYTQNGYGLNVNIDHQNGYHTKYAHMSKAVVENGQRIKRGQLIGYSGNTGLSTGPHLHYEVHYQGVKVDPVDFFYKNLSPQQYRKLKLNKSDATPNKLKEALNAPSMD